MNNRNREHEQRERAQRNRHSTSGHGSDEDDYGSTQAGSQLFGGHRGEQDDRDVQGDYSGDRTGPRQQGYGREGSYPQASYRRRDEPGHLGASQYERPQSERARSGSAQYGSAQSGSGFPSGRSAALHDRRDTGGGYGSRREFDDQDFSQDYSQGSSHYGSQGFGAQGSQGVFGPQGFGAQAGIGSGREDYGSSSGGYSREGYGAREYTQAGPGRQGRPGQWRTGDVTGQGYGSTGNSYRGLGPKNYTRSDERIREDLNERLTDSDDIDASGITVEVSNGVATLSGTVDQRWMKHRAEDIADACSGVRDVNNQIRLRSASQDAGQQSSNRGCGSASTESGANASQSPGAGSQSSTPGYQASGSSRSELGRAANAAGASNAAGSGSIAESGASGTQGQPGSSGSPGAGAPSRGSGSPGSGPR